MTPEQKAFWLARLLPDAWAVRCPHDARFNRRDVPAAAALLGLSVSGMAHYARLIDAQHHLETLPDGHERRQIKAAHLSESVAAVEAELRAVDAPADLVPLIQSCLSELAS